MLAICKRLLCSGFLAVCCALSAFSDENETDEFLVVSSVSLGAQISSTTAAAEPIQYSTVPVGSWFVRHVADQLNEDVKMLGRMEKRGFSRSEIITLVILSKQTDKPLKDLAKERLKDRPSLRTMAERVGLDYGELYNVVQTLKKDIEDKGNTDLPPPVFEPLPADSRASKPVRKKNKRKPSQSEDQLKP